MNGHKKSVIADAFLFFSTPLHVKSFAEPAWSVWSSITIAQLALDAISALIYANVIYVACAVNRIVQTKAPRYRRAFNF